jgi:TatD DNase family protein
MVLETDCPFLAPEPFRGKTNEPAYTAFTAARIAQLSQRDIEEVWRVTAKNAAAFFGL